MKKILFLCLLHTVTLVYGMENPSEQANNFLCRHNLSFQLGSIENDAVASITVFDESGESLRQIEDEETVIFNREFTEFERFERMAYGTVRFSTVPLRLFENFDAYSDLDEEDVEDTQNLFLKLVCMVQNGACAAQVLLFKELEDGTMDDEPLRSMQEIQLASSVINKAIIDVTIDEIYFNSEFKWTIQQLEGQR